MPEVLAVADRMQPRLALLLLLACASAGAGEPAAQGSDPDAVPLGEQAVTTLSVDGARDVTGEGYAFVEMTTPRDTCFVQELIRLRIRFGFDARFLRDNMVQPFRQHLDVPAQLQAPWLERLPGTIAREGEAARPGTIAREGEAARLGGAGDEKRLSCALNESVAGAAQVEDRLIDGRLFTVLEIERSVLPTRSGEMAVPAPVLRFAYATSFEDDFVRGRVGTDRHDAFVRGGRLTLAIRALPEDGRPPEFTGAVGHFRVEAEADPRELAAGESLALSLRIEGEGNLELFDAPRLDRLAGFHLRGQTEKRSTTLRTVRYDLAPLGEEVTEVPSIPFAFFDPSPPGGYRSVRTRPIPIEVRPAHADTGLDPVTSASAPRTPSLALLAGVVLGFALLAIALRARLRGRDRAGRE